MKIVAIVAAALAALLSAYTAAAHFSIRGVNAYLFDTTWGGVFAASKGFTLLAAILCWLLALLFLALLLRKRRRQKKEEKLPVQKEMGQAEAPAGRKAGKERKKRGKKGEEEPRIPPAAPTGESGTEPLIPPAAPQGEKPAEPETQPLAGTGGEENGTLPLIPPTAPQPEPPLPKGPVCPSCGRPVKAGQNFCMKCGAKLNGKEG